MNNPGSRNRSLLRLRPNFKKKGGAAVASRPPTFRVLPAQFGFGTIGAAIHMNEVPVWISNAKLPS
jgi:hypothetical protein